MGIHVEAPGADYTMSETSVYVNHIYLNPSANINITLPTCSEMIDTVIWHVGASNTMVFKKPDTSTLITLSAGQCFRLRSYLDSTDVPQYEAFQSYTASNVSSDRTYDANATSVDELADVIGTLIGDLQTKGVID